jgi:hypothetical protein
VSSTIHGQVCASDVRRFQTGDERHQRGDDVVVSVTTFDDVLPIDRDQIGFCSVDGRAFFNGFSYFSVWPSY